MQSSLRTHLSLAPICGTLSGAHFHVRASTQSKYRLREALGHNCSMIAYAD